MMLTNLYLSNEESKNMQISATIKNYLFGTLLGIEAVMKYKCMTFELNSIKCKKCRQSSTKTFFKFQIVI